MDLIKEYIKLRLLNRSENKVKVKTSTPLTFFVKELTIIEMAGQKKKNRITAVKIINTTISIIREKLLT